VSQSTASIATVVVVATQQEAAAFALKGFDYVLWLSDPCGYAGHGIEHMRTVAQGGRGNGVHRILRSDFVVIFNEHALNRVLGARHSIYWQTHQKYVDMLEPAWWLNQLSKRYLARTPVIKQSNAFHFRLLVLSDFITDGVRRLRNVEIIPRLKLTTGGGT
jgi:hypothetical protein